jgi:hypothetical protein
LKFPSTETIGTAGNKMKDMDINGAAGILSAL